MSKAFASQGDLAEKRETFDELVPGVFALTAEGDPNSGVVIGDDSVLVIDARATPVMAKELVTHIRKVTDKPIRHVLLTHYHAVRVLGTAGYEERINVIASDVTIPGLTWPNVVFHKQMTLWLGSREVQIIHAGRGHTKGDTIAWLPKERVLFSGDLVEYGATPYCGDAHFTDWPGTLDRVASFGAQALVPGRGEALTTPEKVSEGIDETRAFLQDVFRIAREGAASDQPLKQVYDRAMQELRPKYGHWVIFDHCMPFDVSRAYDEAKGIDNPRIWTAERDVEMWQALESRS
jgi:glyoxylase-like metal-dependent hydrolase (beta-lactamase superfamily II)